MTSTRHVLLALFFIMLAVSDLTIGASEKTEMRPRRRRPFPGPTDSDAEAPMTSLSRPWTPFGHRRHHHGKPASHVKETHDMRWTYSEAEIEESCKMEPGCEWTCNEPHECYCRCQLDDQSTQRVPTPPRLIPRQ